MSSSSKVLLSNYLLGQSSGSVLGKNYVKNAIALQNVANVTASGTATVSRNTTTPLTAIADFSISLPNNATDYVEWSLDTLDNALKGQNCELRFDYTASSMGSNVVAQIYQGSNKIAESLPMSINSTSTVVSLNAPCGDLSSATTVRIANGTGNSGTSAIKAANISYGKASNIGSVAQAQFMGSIGWVATAGCTWSRTSSSLANFSADVDCDDNARTVTGSIVDNAFSTPGQYPAFVLKNVQPGRYVIIGRGRFAKQNTSNDGCYFAFSDQTNTSSISSIANNGQEDGLPSISGEFSYTTAQGDVTFSVVARNQSAGACAIVVDESTTGKTNLEFSVYRFPTSSEIAYRPELQALSWSGYHSGSDCSWSTTSTSYADPSDDATCTFTERTNTNFGTVTTYGASKPGFTWTPKKTGKYFVCGRFPIYNNTANKEAAVQIWDGTTVIGTARTNQNGTASELTSVSVCGIYNVSAISSVSIRAQIRAESSSTTFIGGNTGAESAEWSIFALDQNIPAPVLVGSVTNDYSGATRHVWATVDATCNSSPCTIVAQSGEISSISRSSTGQYVVNFTSGKFSSRPACNVMTEAYLTFQNGAGTSTTFPFGTYNSVGTFTDFGKFSVMCSGQK